MAKKNETNETLVTSGTIPVSDAVTVTNTSTVKEEVKIERKISKQAEVWKTYLENIKTTPQAFLDRFPNSKYKIFILELI